MTSDEQNKLATEEEAKLNRYVMNTYGRYPIVISHGKGAHLFDIAGEDYLDFVGGIAVCALGHAHPTLIDAMHKQISRVSHVSNLYIIPEQITLAKWLVENSFADKVFFCNSGAEANEASFKLARKYAHTKLGIEEPVIITAHASFHGRTLAAITATGQPKYQKHFAPLVPGFSYAIYNDVEDLTRLASEVDSGGKRLAAVLLEPLQGEGGVTPGERAFFARAREICNKTGALLMFDEVQTGLGRTGKLWGYENLEIVPDVLTSAKALGGGIPIGAMLAKSFCDIFEPGEHATTFGGNQLACAAAIAVTAVIGSDGFLEQVQKKGERLRKGLLEIKCANPAIFQQVRGWGLMNGLVLTEGTTLTAGDFVKAAIKEKLLLLPAGPKVLRFVPPLVVTEDEIDECIARLKRTVAALT